MWDNYMHGIHPQEAAPMSLGLADRQGNLLDDMEQFCDRALPDRSIYSVLHRERDRLFPDELFDDLFSDKGRHSVPPSVVATVMVLQRLEGLSDREAVERYAFDTRWRYAAGVGSYDCGGWTGFAHTVLVDMRARLARSKDPRRIFNVTVEAAGAAGLVGQKRVLDSTPLYDAVATMDTITLIRSAIRGLLKVAGPYEPELWALLRSGDDYASSAKPQIDWDDKEAREALIDSRAKDGYALLAHLDGEELGPVLAEAARLLATVLGQDLEESDDGTFKIARRVAKDRVISTVDPETRHGHKTSARGFDGYKGHIAIDPDSEIITETVVTSGNAGDASVAETLVSDLTGEESASSEDDEQAPKEADAVRTAEPSTDGASRGGATQRARRARSSKGRDKKAAAAARAARRALNARARAQRRAARAHAADAKTPEHRPAVYGDAAYGSGSFLDHLATAGIDSYCKTQPPIAPAGRFAKDRFAIDLERDEVTCPRGVTVAIKRNEAGDGVAAFGDACTSCPLRAQCTEAREGRSVSVSRYEHRLAEARCVQREPEWQEEYRATRPKVERKLGHLMFRKHGGRRARVRGKRKVDADFNLLAAAHNLARLSTLGLRSTSGGWAVASG
jgi:hypothetical protein